MLCLFFYKRKNDFRNKKTKKSKMTFSIKLMVSHYQKVDDIVYVAIKFTTMWYMKAHF